MRRREPGGSQDVKTFKSNGTHSKTEQNYKNEIKPNVKPIQKDPALRIKSLTSSVDEKSILLDWKDIKQAKLYTLYENEVEIYSGENPRFEKEVTPGIEFCYTVKASSDFELEGQISNRMKFQGKDVITWSINDYLGLANHPEVRRVDAEASNDYGAAYPMGARMMSGHTALHEQLQQELAAFVNKEAAYVLNFGYQGIMSTVDALVGKEDVIFYDVDAHACIVDGVRLHLGKRFTFKLSLIHI